MTYTMILIIIGAHKLVLDHSLGPRTIPSMMRTVCEQQKFDGGQEFHGRRGFHRIGFGKDDGRCKLEPLVRQKE